MLDDYEEKKTSKIYIPLYQRECSLINAGQKYKASTLRASYNTVSKSLMVIKGAEFTDLLDTRQTSIYSSL